MKNDMKVIMESWTNFSKHSEKQILKEGFREILLALSIFAGGATIFAQMDNDKEVTQQQIKGELDKVSKNTKKLADLPSFGLDSGDQDSKQKIINMIDGAYSDSIIPPQIVTGE